VLYVVLLPATALMHCGASQEPLPQGHGNGVPPARLTASGASRVIRFSRSYVSHVVSVNEEVNNYRFYTPQTTRKKSTLREKHLLLHIHDYTTIHFFLVVNSTTLGSMKQ
jgi:hypothetical protein